MEKTEIIESDAELYTFEDSLLRISQDLTETEIGQLKFICSDVITREHVDNMDAITILRTLLKKRLITPERVDFLVECLILIGRVDIAAKHLGCERVIDELCNNLAKYKSSKFSEFNILLFNLANNITREEVRNIMSYLGKGDLETCLSGFDLIAFLIKADLVRHNNLNTFTQIAKRLNRMELIERIKIYSANKPAQNSAPSAWLELVQCIPSDKQFRFSEYLLIPRRKYKAYHGNLTELLIDCYGKDMFNLEELEVAFNNLNLDIQFSLKIFKPSSEPAPTDWLELVQLIPQAEYYSFTQALQIPRKKYKKFNGNLRELLSHSFGESMFNLTQLEVAFNNLNLENIQFSKEKFRPTPSEPENENPIPEPCQNELEKYPMNTKPRGICLIINNEHFQTEKLKTRIGSGIDRDDLKEMFEEFHFEIIVANDLTKEEMEEKLKDVASKDHSRYDCFVCCILSHGLENGIYGVDGLVLSIENFKTPFKSNNSKGLIGKPKLFFIQACQGKKYTNPVKGWNTDGVNTESDFLMSHATVHGFVAFRNTNKGSWFIQKLCDVFKQNAKKYDVTQMMLMVNNEVCKLSGQIEQSVNGQNNQLVCVQVPAPVSTLTKALYFLNDLD